MGRVLIFVYGLLAYAVGMGGLVYFMLFVGGWSFLPLHVDSTPAGPLARALSINIGLMVLFGLQHSVMARASFKLAVAKLISPAAERSTYVLLSGVLMALICLGWAPIKGVVWDVGNPFARNCLTAVQILGWLLAVTATFVINHFELFGLQRVYCHLTNRHEPRPIFSDRLLYKVVRHPLQLGILIGVWSTATMSMSHLMLSASMSVYILVGLYFEEGDLVVMLGKDYEDYRRRVRMLLPLPKFGRGPT